MPLEDSMILGLMALNTLLAGVLFYIYMRNWKSIKSRFTIGLAFFSAAFLTENMLDLYFYNSILEQSLYGFTTFAFAVNFLEFIGLLILLYITWK